MNPFFEKNTRKSWKIEREAQAKKLARQSNPNAIIPEEISLSSSPPKFQIIYFEHQYQDQIKKLKIHTPRQIFIFSDPFMKLTKQNVLNLKKIKSMKIYGIKSYGYSLVQNDENRFTDELLPGHLEPTINSIRGEARDYNELYTLLSSNTNLRTLVQLTRPRKFNNLKMNQKLAFRQKRLSKYGFHTGYDYYRYSMFTSIQIPEDSKKTPPFLPQFPLQTFSSYLKFLTIRADSRDPAKIKGISKLSNLEVIRFDSPAGDVLFTEGNDGYDEIPKNPTFNQYHINILSQVVSLPKLRKIILFSYFILFENDFLEKFLTLISSIKNSININITSVYHLTRGLNSPEDGLPYEQLYQQLAEFASEKCQISFKVIDDDQWAAESKYQSGGTRGIYSDLECDYLEEYINVPTYKKQQMKGFFLPESKAQCVNCFAPYKDFKCDHNNPKHIQCWYCMGLMPDLDTIQNKCKFCQRVSCKKYYDLVPHADISGVTCLNERIFPRSFDPDSFGRSKVEKNEQMDHFFKQRKGITWMLRDYLKSLPEGKYEFKQLPYFFPKLKEENAKIITVEKEDCLCDGCCRKVFLTLSYDFWQSIYPEKLQEKPKCYQGIRCKNISDADHDEKYSHIIDYSEYVPLGE